MLFQARHVVDRIRAEAAGAEQALLELTPPALVPAFAGEAAAHPGDVRPARGHQPAPIPPAPRFDAPLTDSGPDPDTILEEILALTEDLDRQSRCRPPLVEESRPRGPLGALAAARRRWLQA